MAICHSINFRSLSTHSLHLPNTRLLLPNHYSPETSISSLRKKPKWQFQGVESKRRRFQIRNSLFLCPVCISKRENNGYTVDGFSEIIGNLARLFGSGFPWGSWWSLFKDEEPQFAAAKPFRVSFAIRRMWELIGDDRWIVLVGFGALIGAAVSSSQYFVFELQCMVVLKEKWVFLINVFLGAAFRDFNAWYIDGLYIFSTTWWFHSVL